MSPPGFWVLLPTSKHHTTNLSSSHCRPLWVTLHSSPLMAACRNWWWKWGQVHMTSVWQWKVSRVSDHAGRTEHHLLGKGVEKPPVGYGFPSNHTKHGCWIWKDLWPCHSMGTTPSSLLPHSTGGSPQTCAARGWKCRLGIHLFPT